MIQPNWRVTRIHSRLVLLVLALVAPQLGAAEQRLDIVQVLGQFVQASYAASRCSKPDQATLANFLTNLRIVTVRAVEELKKRNPSRTDNEIVEELKLRTSAVESAIDRVIQENGCNDPRIQDLLRRFEMQANLRF